jgi:hypothetical protein
MYSIGINPEGQYDLKRTSSSSKMRFDGSSRLYLATNAHTHYHIQHATPVPDITFRTRRVQGVGDWHPHRRQGGDKRMPRRRLAARSISPTEEHIVCPLTFRQLEGSA